MLAWDLDSFVPGWAMLSQVCLVIGQVVGNSPKLIPNNPSLVYLIHQKTCMSIARIISHTCRVMERKRNQAREGGKELIPPFLRLMDACMEVLEYKDRSGINERRGGGNNFTGYLCFLQAQ